MTEGYDYIIIGGGSAGCDPCRPADARIRPIQACCCSKPAVTSRTAETPHHLRIPNPLRAIGDDDH